MITRTSLILQHFCIYFNYIQKNGKHQIVEDLTAFHIFIKHFSEC